MAGYGLAGAGAGGLAAAGLQAGGVMPTDSLQLVEQLRAEGIEPPPELEEQARGEQLRQLGVAALAVGAGVGGGLLVERFAGRPEVVKHLAEKGGGGGGEVAVPVGPSPQDPLGGAYAVTGRIGTEDDVKRAMNLVLQELPTMEASPMDPKAGLHRLMELAKEAGAEELGSSLDFVKSNWDGRMETHEDFYRRMQDQIHSGAAEEMIQQAVVNAVTPEIVRDRTKMQAHEEGWRWFLGGHDDDNAETMLIHATKSPGLKPEERQLLTALRFSAFARPKLHRPSQSEVMGLVHSLDEGDAGEWQDAYRARIEYHGGDPTRLTLPEWMINFKGIGKKKYREWEPAEQRAKWYAEEMKKLGHPLNEEEIQRMNIQYELEDKHRRIRLGLG